GPPRLSFRSPGGHERGIHGSAVASSTHDGSARNACARHRSTPPKLGKARACDPLAVQPQVPAELVIDHSVIADVSGRADAFRLNSELEFERNQERYRFLRWGQQAFTSLKVVPPGTGICHQVNLEHLARVVFDENGEAYPDTLLGTDSHTTMVNGLGVLGWGVGGIEAEAVMLGQPYYIPVPEVVGFKL